MKKLIILSIIFLSIGCSKAPEKIPFVGMYFPTISEVEYEVKDDFETLEACQSWLTDKVGANSMNAANSCGSDCIIKEGFPISITCDKKIFFYEQK